MMHWVKEVKCQRDFFYYYWAITQGYQVTEPSLESEIDAQAKTLDVESFLRLIDQEFGLECLKQLPDKTPRTLKTFLTYFAQYVNGEQSELGLTKLLPLLERIANGRKQSAGFAVLKMKDALFSSAKSYPRQHKQLEDALQEIQQNLLS